MDNKKIFSSLMIVGFLAVLAFIVAAIDGGNMNNVWITGVNSPGNGSNATNGQVNLSLYFYEQNASWSINNVTFIVKLSNSSLAQTFSSWNGSSFDIHAYVLRNLTYRNTTVNQTKWLANFSLTESRLNTLSTSATSLPDGVYNVSYYYCNMSLNVGDSNCNTASFMALDILVDNTVPVVSPVTANGSAYIGPTVTHLFNFSIQDLSVRSTGNGSNPAMVVFSISNGSTTASGNYTAHNGSGTWAISSADINLSHFQAGNKTVTAYVNDSGNNSNRNQVIRFFSNTPQNITWDVRFNDTNNSNSYVGFPRFQNFSGNNGTNQSAGFTPVQFNITVRNFSYIPGGVITNVIFMFDNASGNGFNLTANVTANQTTTSAAGGVAFSFNVSYNVSALVEGNHTVKVYINDTYHNFNNTEYISFVVDKTAPSITVTCESSKTVGQTVSCTCSASDSLVGLKHAGIFLGDTDNSEATVATAAGTFTTSTCAATDWVGNRGTGTGTYTILASSGAAGGGSAGSGGGSSSGVSGQFEKKTWTSILAGETASVEVDNGLVGVTEVSFAVEDTIYGAWVQVKKVDTLPSSVGSFARKAYRNIEITESRVEETMKDKATIKFKVEKSWLVNEKLKKDDVALFRYADDKWNELPTKVGADDGTYIYYEAESTGFSYFIIGEKAEKVAVPEDEAEEEAEVAPPEAAEGTAAEGEAGAEVEIGGKRGILVWLIPLVVVAVIIGLVYYFWRRE